MNTNTIRGRSLSALACIGLALSAPGQALAAGDDDATGAAFFGVEEKVNGLMFGRSDWIQLRESGVLIQEPFLQSELQAVAERDGVASRKMLRALDKYSKEGTAISVYRLSGEGITLVANYKGTDIAGNCFRMAGWSLAGNSKGTMLYNHFVCNENWQTILAKTATTAVGAAFANSAANATANLTAPKHEGDNWYVQGGRGGEAVAGASNVNVSQQEMVSKVENSIQNGASNGCATGGTCYRSGH